MMLGCLKIKLRVTQSLGVFSHRPGLDPASMMRLGNESQ